MAGKQAKAAADNGDGVKIDAGRDPLPNEAAGDGAVRDSNDAGIFVSGGDSITPGTVEDTTKVMRSDDERISDIRTGVVADNQPGPDEVWDTEKQALVKRKS